MVVNEAYRIVIDHLDTRMRQDPSQKLADVSNYLEDVLEGLEESAPGVEGADV